MVYWGMGDRTLLKVLVQISLAPLIKSQSIFTVCMWRQSRIKDHCGKMPSAALIWGFSRLHSAFIKLPLVVQKMARVNTIRQQCPLINCLPKCFCVSHEECSQLHIAIAISSVLLGIWIFPHQTEQSPSSLALLCLFRIDPVQSISIWFNSQFQIWWRENLAVSPC